MFERIAIIGAGFSGAVIARELAPTGRFAIDVYDDRSHVGGNCHTVRDESTSVMVHAYGPHIFHTSDEEVRRYVNSFGLLRPFENRVKAVTARGVFSIPVNLLTINQLFGKSFTPREAEAFVREQAVSFEHEPRNFEEQALAFLGEIIYENFFRGYTQKQWGLSPRELPASILKRLPVRFTYNDNYYFDRYQGIPEDGYTAIITRILDHDAISVFLNTFMVPSDLKGYTHVFWSGPVDAYFGHRYGRLRSAIRAYKGRRGLPRQRRDQLLPRGGPAHPDHGAQAFRTVGVS